MNEKIEDTLIEYSLVSKDITVTSHFIVKEALF
ncbi:hypothetical protein CTER_2171 [Ruminiclostridium cellobioparum subsp. termitidis CT1112]|jgi:hypothetical protein|uniref:Uncharacterized protein n=1 Tax=Ruminiclostridium cellobioparum subsp. termitidis CT1112 TaxID=1195236 RepID=S0FTW2_RUMCE|nr:hypothetical protein CTER_2171 [Ruminiclostridium cellobioparum subsp. termitidis CT1112]